MFFTNFIPPMVAAMYPSLATAGELRTALDPDLKLSCLDPAGIGRFAARALVEHTKWQGEIVPLASAHLTMPQIAEKLTDAVGGKKQVKAVPFSDEELAAERNRNPLVDSELFRSDFRVAVNLDEVRSYGVHLRSWDEFARLEKKPIEVALGLA